jgi:DNA-binding LacI/PurR family transcriptional regulator
LRVPEDISVVGFDDIRIAVHNNPSLTTVRQPLQKMGEIAARTLLNRIEEPEDWVQEISIEPEFVVRESTARAPSRPAAVRNNGGSVRSVPLAEN